MVNKVPEAGVEAPAPAPASPEAEWDLDTLQDLLELSEEGVNVSWPGGMDPLSAKELVQKRKQSLD